MNLPKLRLQLREWRQECSGDGDAEILKGIDGALISTQPGDKVKNNRFLIMLCTCSLRADMATVAETYEEGEI